MGLTIDDDPAHVWHQEIVAPGHVEGYDGLANDYFLVRTTSFDPHGALSAVELTAEHISGFTGGGARTLQDTGEPTCSHPVTSRRR